MKFSIRDVLLLMALLGTAAASVLFGFLLGDARKRMTLEMENSTMKIEQYMDRGRIEAAAPTTATSNSHQCLQSGLLSNA